MKVNSRSSMLVIYSMVIWALWGCAAPPDTLHDIFDVEDHPRIAAYLSGDEQRVGMKQVGDHWDKLLYDDEGCEDEAKITPFSLTLQSPVVFPENCQHPTKGSWQQRYQYERCKRKDIYNAVFEAKKGAPPQVFPGTPGTSNASAQLIVDSLEDAKAAARQKVTSKECQELSLVEANVVLPPEIKDKNGRIRKGPWIEEWIFDVCGQKVSVFGLFLQKGQGATLSSFQ